MKYLGKRGKPRNILQKYVLKSQMNNPELWESVMPTQSLGRQLSIHLQH